MKKVNDMYEAPFLEVAEIEVESGIAGSPNGAYGDYGEAGQGSGYINYGDGEEDYL